MQNGLSKREQRGTIRLYRNGEEQRRAPYHDRKRAQQLFNIWMGELKHLKKHAIYHISWEPEIKD